MRHGKPVDLEAEHLPAVVLAPALATGLFYALPPDLQASTLIQFLPQFLAYVGLAVWTSRNQGIMERLGLKHEQWWQGVRWGLGVGFVLGLCNSWVILHLVRGLGADIRFLEHTAHAKVPFELMLPWVIVLIAAFVELNFRGFQLGRWLALSRQLRVPRSGRAAPALAVGTTALVFAFDPFLVTTFKHLHWIAIWDALVWGALWLRLRNLYATIVAHAVEVMIVYSAVRYALT